MNKVRVLSSFEPVIEFFRLLFETVSYSVLPPYRVSDIFKQINYIAIQSAPVVILCLAFASVVVIIEASFHMKLVIQNDALVPGFASLLILRELGAVVTALLVTSRVGAGLAAEVGTMKVTDQLDALKMLNIDPVRYLVVPRFIASLVSGALLTVIANVFCLYCAMLVSQLKLGYTPGAFLMSMRAFVEMKDLYFSIIKGVAFFSVIPIMSCFYGFRCKAGAEGVGLATTGSVVATSVTIIFLDFLLTWIFSYMY